MLDARAVPLRRRLVCAVLCALALWPGWEAWHVVVGGNVHEVLPGRVYRGAQPSARRLDELVTRYGLRTIVNLRGCCAPDEWYLDETRVSRKHGINHEDLTFAATRLPSANEMRRLLEILDHSEPPIFFHCRQGADRTGLAAAVAMLLQPDVPYAEARRQLSLRYLHVSFGQTGRLDQVFDLYEDYLRTTQQSHKPEVFRHWVEHEYQGGWCYGRIEKVERLNEPRAGQPLGYRFAVRNLGPTTWRVRPTSSGGVHIGCRLSDETGRDVYEGRGGLIEAEVGPGQLYVATLVVPLPGPGRYRLIADVLEEGHCWFYQMGSEPWEEELVVHE